MAPMKFEENMKEKLASRTIKPSAEAWERVASELDEKPKRRSSKIRYWGLIAAGFIGVLILAGGLFFTAEKADIQPIVDAANEIEAGPKTKPQEKIVPKTRQNQLKITENQDEKLINQRLKRQNTAQNPVKPEPRLDIPLQPKEQMVEAETPIKNNQNFDPSIEHSIDLEVNRLLAQVDSMGQNSMEVTDAQVDALLAQARVVLIKNRAYEEQTQSLSATALLQDVEQELDRSFRDRIFEALKDRFIKAREAIASRND
ncbi:MAG TPA: hypothetical protein ENH91_00750 [Leeuwenhoekiella sp.]|nr:hypothetical protein [Leeuwenhoekiella sp.]